MATERFINGKKDNARHCGLYANRKWLEEAINQIDEFGLEEFWAFYDEFILPEHQEQLKVVRNNERV